MEISRLKSKVMPRDMRIFVSLVVWLFSITGADGALTIQPENNVLVKGSTATFYCSSDKEMPQWFYRTYSEELVLLDATNENCTSLVKSFDAVSPGPNACDLTVKDNTVQSTWLFLCGDVDRVLNGILIFIESPLKCAIVDDQLGCTLVHSAYNNQSEMSRYLSNRLIWRSDTDDVVADAVAGFQDTTTVVKAEIPDSISVGSPYVCSAEFKMEGGFEGEYSPVVNIIPDGKLQCKFPETAAQEQSAQAAAAKSRSGKTSNAKLERDAIDAIAMLMSLIAAFLVL